MHKQDTEQETSPEIVYWLESLRDWAPEYQYPDDPESEYLGRIIDITKAVEKNFVIVPRPESWAPGEEQDRILPILRRNGFTRLYGLGFLYKENLHLSAEVNSESLNKMIFQYFGYFLLVPRNEEFLILHTNFEYWILAGPLSLVEEMLGTSLDNAFDEFVKTVVAGGDDEPGPIFAADIVSRYRRHNRRVLAAVALR